MVIEEETLAGIKGSNLGHILVAESEIENVDVLLHAFDVHRLGYYDDSSLNELAQCYLSY